MYCIMQIVCSEKVLWLHALGKIFKLAVVWPVNSQHLARAETFCNTRIIMLATGILLEELCN